MLLHISYFIIDDLGQNTVSQIYQGQKQIQIRIKGTGMLFMLIQIWIQWASKVWDGFLFAIWTFLVNNSKTIEDLHNKFFDNYNHLSR